jgi:hypothetical protein
METTGQPGGKKPPLEEIKVTGENLLRRIRELIDEGNVRRISIRNQEGHTLLEIPLTMGLVGALFMPVWAAIGAMAAMASGYSIIVERAGGKDDGDQKKPEA